MALVSRVVGALVAGSMLASSSLAGASAPTAPLAQLNPWAALTAMSGGAPAATMCGVAVAAAQPAGGCVLPVADAPPAPLPEEAGPPVPVPVPPIAAPASFGFNPLYLALAAIAAGVGIYFATKHGKSNSPG